MRDALLGREISTRSNLSAYIPHTQPHIFPLVLNTILYKPKISRLKNINIGISTNVVRHWTRWMHASMCELMLIYELSLVYIDLNNPAWAVVMFLPMGHDPHGCTYPTNVCEMHSQVVRC